MPLQILVPSRALCDGAALRPRPPPAHLRRTRRALAARLSARTVCRPHVVRGVAARHAPPRPRELRNARRSLVLATHPRELARCRRELRPCLAHARRSLRLPLPRHPRPYALAWPRPTRVPPRPRGARRPVAYLLFHLPSCQEPIRPPPATRTRAKTRSGRSELPRARRKRRRPTVRTTRRTRRRTTPSPPTAAATIASLVSCGPSSPPSAPLVLQLRG